MYSTAKETGQINDIYSQAVTRLTDMKRESTYPIVRRKSIQRLTLYLQLVMGVQIRLVMRQQFGLELKQRVAGQSLNKSSSLAVSAHTSTSYTAPRSSTPVTSSYTNQSVAAMPSGRKRPPSTNKESDKVREARLRRFEKTPTPNITVSARKKPPTSSWHCKRCTLENSLDAATCLACNEGGPMKAASAAAKVQSTWACSKCTFANNHQSTHCSACNAPKVPPTSAVGGGIDWENYDREHGSNHINNAHLQRYNDNRGYYRQQPQQKEKAADSTASNSYQNSSTTATPTPSKPKRCGACGSEGHNRSTANEHNCSAYFSDKEIDRRERIRLKRQKEIEDEKDALVAIRKESSNAERMQAELQKQIQELERNKERAESFRKEELKKRMQKIKRLEKKQNKG